MTILLLILVVALAVVLFHADTRRLLLGRAVYRYFQRSLPPMSATEREAMEAGDTWWEGELFRGKPDWNTLHAYPQPQLSAEEQAFLDHQVETLLAMIDDYKIVSELQDLPPEVWDYLKREKFFALNIAREYGGLKFSALANSTIVARIASKSLSAAVTVMVPNSLGPGELLSHYGTEAQKQRWLPALADGREIPCFALTGPEAGSDAGAIPDEGVVCRGDYNGETVLGIRLSWSKRYITLAPVATVVGLAFKLRDPDGLLGGKEELGITCALVPASHPGVKIGDRHKPMNQAFMNGTTEGKDVFIPIDWIIGGPDYAGKGWRMLVECLSAGRGISLPALGTAATQLAARTTGAYAFVRRQFGLSLGKFEGVQLPMAEIGANAYRLEAMRTLTTTALDLNHRPGVLTAIAKYHMTELARKAMTHAMDIHAGRGIQCGPLNYLAHQYMGMPIAITVEGANILTRNLMIFGQGATRCHPYIFAEMEAAALADGDEGLKRFDQLLVGHVRYALANLGRALWLGLTAARFYKAPVSGETAPYYGQLARFSAVLAFVADIAMLVLGGSLKRREGISARLGDVLSHLYMASATLKRYEGQGRQQADLPYVHFALQDNLQQMGEALDGFFANFGPRWLALTLRTVLFPWGLRFAKPSDRLSAKVAEAMMQPGVARDRLTPLCHVGSGDEPVAIMEQAFLAMNEGASYQSAISAAQKAGTLPRRLPLDQLIDLAASQGVLTPEQAKRMRDSDELRRRAIAVDSFKPA